MRATRRRIAHKLFLFHVLPLSVLMLAGLALPIFLWYYLGQIINSYAESLQFHSNAVKLSQLAHNNSLVYHDFIYTQEPEYQSRSIETNRSYRSVSVECQRYIDTVGDPLLQASYEVARDAYNNWHRERPRPDNRFSRNNLISPRENRALLVTSTYVPVQAKMDSLVANANQHMTERYEKARVADAMRRVTVFTVPALALILSVLIGRSIALGITRPIESLTQATEELEQGGDALLLTDLEAAPVEYTDELGELQSAFARMARTIRQRETILRAQNEALGSLNQRVESVLNATNDGILMLDRTGAFSVVNQQFALLFGIEAEVLLDQTFAQAAPLILARFKNRATVRAALERLLDDPEASADETVEVIEPTARTLRLYSAPVRGEMREGKPPELLGRIFVFRDVTREMIVDRMKTEFVSTVSHELRTPLTAIKGYVDIMVAGTTGPLNETQTEFLVMMQSSTERLHTLINDLLDVSRIESGRMEIRRESVDYVTVVQQAVRMMHNEADARNIQLGITVADAVAAQTPQVLGDADRITQVLVNLISNGIKYTPSGGTVTLEIEFNPAEQVVLTCVADNGIGIHADDLPRLFTKFFRADNSTTRETGGTGLGLAITKATVEKMRGVIWVESTPGEGSRFWFTLPLTPTIAEGASDAVVMSTSAPKAQTTPATTTTPLMLSIDGDRAALHRLGHSLRHHGWVTSTAATAAEALRRARGLRPDLITLDPLSPGFDGFALLGRLQTDAATANIPIVLLSLRQSGSDAVARNTYCYLPRSVERDTLHSTIRAMLSEFTPVGDEAPIIAGVLPENTQNILRHLLLETTQDMGVDDVTIVLSEHFAEVEALLDHRGPWLLLLDTACAPAEGFGEWVCHLRDQQTVPTRLPILALTEPTLALHLAQTLPTWGEPVVPLPAIGEKLRAYLPDDDKS